MTITRELIDRLERRGEHADTNDESAGWYELAFFSMLLWKWNDAYYTELFDEKR